MKNNHIFMCPICNTRVEQYSRTEKGGSVYHCPNRCIFAVNECYFKRFDKELFAKYCAANGTNEVY